MITYDKLVESVSEIINNELIYKEGLELIYYLEEENYEKLNEHFFYKINKNMGVEFENTEEFEVELGGITIKFKIKK